MLLENLKEKRGYWKLKEEALDRSLWRTSFGRGYRPVVRQMKERMNIFSYCTVRNPSNPCQLCSLAAMLCQQTVGCRQPFYYGKKGLIVYERVCLVVILDTKNFRAMIRVTCISFGHG
jgi:hypothetical protein